MLKFSHVIKFRSSEQSIAATLITLVQPIEIFDLVLKIIN